MRTFLDSLKTTRKFHPILFGYSIIDEKYRSYRVVTIRNMEKVYREIYANASKCSLVNITRDLGNGSSTSASENRKIFENNFFQK